MPSAIVVRPVISTDVPTVARLAAQLSRYHFALDPRRYMTIDRIEEGYGAFFTGELANPKAILLCAVREASSDVVGYAYGTLEGRDWNQLLDPHGALHDILVDSSARERGVASKLIVEICRRFEELGAPRIILHTAVQNREAQAVFAKRGFRPTMIEMTREVRGKARGHRLEEGGAIAERRGRAKE